MAPATRRQPESSQKPSEVKIEPDLARIMAVWPMLPEPIRRAVLALIDSARECFQPE